MVSETTNCIADVTGVWLLGGACHSGGAVNVESGPKCWCDHIVVIIILVFIIFNLLHNTNDVIKTILIMNHNIDEGMHALVILITIGLLVVKHVIGSAIR